MEHQAANDPRFREALTGVWTHHKAATTEARIARAAEPDHL